MRGADRFVPTFPKSSRLFILEMAAALILEPSDISKVRHMQKTMRTYNPSAQEVHCGLFVVPWDRTLCDRLAATCNFVKWAIRSEPIRRNDGGGYRFAKAMGRRGRTRTERAKTSSASMGRMRENHQISLSLRVSQELTVCSGELSRCHARGRSRKKGSRGIATLDCDLALVPVQGM